MKILHFKIGNKFRSLPENFEITFPVKLKDDSDVDFLKPDFSNIQDDEPLCLVGINGSGKSNLLEALAETYAYLDELFIKENKNAVKSTFNSFELSYLLPLTYSIKFLNYGQLGQLGATYGTSYLKITIEKEIDHLPTFQVTYNNNVLSVIGDESILPFKIIGYSSGQNEILSIPFFKAEYNYYDISQQYRYVTDSQDAIYGKLKYMDFEESSFVFLANALLHESNPNPIYAKLGIEDVFSFDLIINTKYRNKHNIELSGQLKKLYEFVTDHCTNLIPLTSNNNTFKFTVTESLKSAFRESFIDSEGLYKVFREFGLLNLNAVPKYKVKQIRNAGEDFFKNYRIAEFEPERQLFSIQNIKIKKENIQNPIDYRNLSDGEHQFLYIFGILQLFRNTPCLFLFDEPETHFNPQWKYDFVDTLRKCSDNFRSQIILTTHDPVLLSGLPRENVMVFNKPNEQSARIYMPEKDLKGMGVDAILTSSIFGFITTIDKLTYDLQLERRVLYIESLKRNLNAIENEKLIALTEKLSDYDFTKPFNDPILIDYLKLMDNIDVYRNLTMTYQQIAERKKFAEETLKKLRDEI